MSVQASNWAWKPHGVRGVPKLVLVYLAGRADKEGRGAHPTVAEMVACECGHEKTVRDALKLLQALGLAKVVGRHSNGANIYDLPISEAPLPGQLTLASDPTPGRDALPRHAVPRDATPPREATPDYGVTPPLTSNVRATRKSDCVALPSQEDLREEGLSERTNCDNASSEIKASDARASSIERARDLWPRATTEERVLLQAAVAVAEARNNGKVLQWAPEGVAELAHVFADRDLPGEAEKWRAWHCPGGLGENKPLSNLTASLRTWLGRSPTLTAVANARGGQRGTGPQFDEDRFKRRVSVEVQG